MRSGKWVVGSGKWKPETLASPSFVFLAGRGPAITHLPLPTSDKVSP